MRGSKSALLVLDARALFLDRHFIEAQTLLTTAREQFAESRTRLMRQDPDKPTSKKQGKEAEQAIAVQVASPEFKEIVDQLVKENRQSCLALGSNIRVVVNGKNYLITSGK